MLKNSTFYKLQDLFYRLTGIKLKENKKYLVENRLSKFVGENKNFKTFEDFYDALVTDPSGNLKNLLIQALITNYTFFFREPIHFSFLRWYLRNNKEKQPYLRIWSCGCSTGEEAYSIAITALMELPNLQQYDFKILASDVVKEYILQAKQGIFSKHKLENFNKELILKYFDYLPHLESYQIKQRVKEFIAFRILNLISPFPFTKEFDIIFLRNVLIYFTLEEKKEIIKKIYPYIKRNGYLILGLTESLTGIPHSFEVLKYSIYKK
ncbi:MAG: CheR family methyltransferase [Leptonema sp. (in: bacteria)]